MSMTDGGHHPDAPLYTLKNYLKKKEKNTF